MWERDWPWDKEGKWEKEQQGGRKEREQEAGKTETCRGLRRELFILAYSQMIYIIVVEMILTRDCKVYFPEAKQVTSQVTWADWEHGEPGACAFSKRDHPSATLVINTTSHRGSLLYTHFIFQWKPGYPGVQMKQPAFWKLANIFSTIAYIFHTVYRVRLSLVRGNALKRGLACEQPADNPWWSRCDPSLLPSPPLDTRAMMATQCEESPTVKWQS